MYKGVFYNPTMAAKSFDLGNITADEWRMVFGTPPPDNLSSPYALYSNVATLYACVDRRAKAVEGMPFVFKREGSDEPLDDSNTDVQLLTQDLRTKLYNIESSLCIWSAAYLLPNRNRIGFSYLQQLATPTITIMYDATMGIKWFQRSYGSVTQKYAPDQLIYIWRDSLIQDVGPALSPVQAASNAASVVLGINQTVTKIYQSGLLKAFIISVGQNPPPNAADMKKLEETFKQRILRGVKTIFEPIAVRADVKPEIISSDLKESYPVEMVNSANDEIIRVMGVPKSLLESSALAGGTVDAERLNFYDFTVLPEIQVICDDLNDQYYTQMGLKVEPQPSRLEVYKRAMVSQAVVVSSLTGGKAIITVDEARELIGRQPSPELAQEQQQKIEQQQAQTEALAQARQTQSPAEQADQRVAMEQQRLKRYANHRLLDGRAWKFTSDILSQADIDRVAACKSAEEIEGVSFEKSEAMLIVEELKRARETVERMGKG